MGVRGFLGTLMTSNEALIALPDGDVTRARSIARLIPSQRWMKEAVEAIRGVPARPRPKCPSDDSRIETFNNPHLMMDAELKSKLEEEDFMTSDLPLCLHDGRKLPSLRITKQDLDRYGPTSGCPRCFNYQSGYDGTANHWESCRRRIYRLMYQSEDPKLLKWIKDHPTDQAKVGPAIGLSPTPAAASSSTSAPPAAHDLPVPPCWPAGRR